MSFRAPAIAALAAALTVTAAPTLQAQDAPTADTVIATVGETEITLGEMIIARSRLPVRFQQMPPEMLFDGLLEQLVQQELLAATVTEVPSRVQMALANERRSLLAGEVITALNDEVLTDEAIAAAYEARFADSEPATEYNASHILVETEEEALAIQEELEAGADFPMLAAERSIGPSGPNGGQLGWFGTGRMVPEFEAAVVAMEPETISNPVETQFGWHVIRLNETRAQPLPTLEEIRDEIAGEIQQEAIESRLAELEAVAEIRLPEAGAFDPTLLTNTDLLEK